MIPRFLFHAGNKSDSYDADAEAYFTAASITDVTQKNAWNTFVVSAKAAGYWSKFYAVYPFLGGGSGSHSYNAKNTAQYQITWSGTVTHNSNGVTGSSTSLGNTGFSTSNLSNTSGSIGVYVRTNPSNSFTIPLGGANCYLFTSSTYIYPVYGGVNFVFNTASRTRLIIANKNSTHLQLYRDGSELNSATGSSSLTTGNISVLGHVDFSSNYFDGGLGFAFIASDLSSTEVTNLNSHVNTLMTGLGRNV